MQLKKIPFAQVLRLHGRERPSRVEEHDALHEGLFGGAPRADGKPGIRAL